MRVSVQARPGPPRARQRVKRVAGEGEARSKGQAKRTSLRGKKNRRENSDVRQGLENKPRGIRPNEEAKMKKIPIPKMPSKEEVDDHIIKGHVKFESWCKHCVRGLHHDSNFT